jgi:cytochrome c-type biogenesis protein CcmH/NrfG
MWTYLLIFLSLFCLLLIFVRRLYLVLIKKEDEKVEDKATEPTEKKFEKTRLSRDDKAEIERLYKRSVALIKRKEPKDAVKTLVQALAINPGYKEALKELGKLYLDQKMWGKASAVYKSLAENTNDPVDYSHLGLALYNDRVFDAAASAYQEAVSLDPKRPQRYVSLGHVYLDAEKTPLALIAFNKALHLEGDNVDYLLLVAETHKLLENFDDAKEILKKTMEVAPMGKMAPRILKEVESLERKAKRA